MVDGPVDWSAWRLLLSPARPSFESLCAAGVGGLDSNLLVDAVVGGDQFSAFVSVDGSAVDIPHFVGLTCAQAGGDTGQQYGGDVAER